MRKVVYGESYRRYRLRKCEIEEKNKGFYREPLDRANDLLCCCRENFSKPFFVWFVLKFPAESRFAKRDDNEVICRFIEALCAYYRGPDRRRRFPSVGRKRIQLPLYFWVRELSDSGQYHYHVTIVLNGQLGQDPQKVFYRARNLWAGCINRAAAKENRREGKDPRSVEYFDPDETPIDFGDNDYRDKESGVLSPLRYGGYRIDHYKDAETVITGYDLIFEHLSYYAKIYSKTCDEDLSRSRDADPCKKTKNFGCSQIPRYSETVRDIDLRLRQRGANNPLDLVF